MFAFFLLREDFIGDLIIKTDVAFILESSEWDAFEPCDCVFQVADLLPSNSSHSLIRNSHTISSGNGDFSSELPGKTSSEKSSVLLPKVLSHCSTINTPVQSYSEARHLLVGKPFRGRSFHRKHSSLMADDSSRCETWIGWTSHEGRSSVIDGWDFPTEDAEESDVDDDDELLSEFEQTLSWLSEVTFLESSLPQQFLSLFGSGSIVANRGWWRPTRPPHY